MAGRTQTVLNQVGVNEIAAVGAGDEMFFAAVAADKNVVAVGVNGRFNFVGVKIFVAKVAKHKVVFEATGASERAVAGLENLCDGAIFFAVFAKAVMRVEAMLADMNSFAVTVDDFPPFGTRFVALLTVFVFVGVAAVAIKPAGNFVATANAQTESPDIEDFVVVEMIFANGDFRVEFGVWPVGIAAEAVAGVNVNVAFVAAVLFGEPKIGSVFEFGKFALNEVAIKL